MSERKPKNALREALASTGLPANGSSHGCDVSTTGAQHQQPFIAMTTLNSRLQLALLNRKKGRNLLEKGFTLVELMIVIVIVGVLSSVALPSFLNQTAKAKATECTNKIGAILSQVGAEYLNSATDATTLLGAEITSANSNSALCTFSNASLTTPDYGVNVVGKGDLAGKYAAKSCVDGLTGKRDIDYVTGTSGIVIGSVTTTPTC